MKKRLTLHELEGRMNAAFHRIEKLEAAKPVPALDPLRDVSEEELAEAVRKRNDGAAMRWILNALLARRRAER